MNKKSLGKFLANARLMAQISQLELAEELGYKGPQYVSNWERGVCVPPIDKFYEISELLKVDRQELFDVLMEDATETVEASFRSQIKKSKKASR